MIKNQEFGNEVMKAVEEKLGDGFIVKLHDVTKNNGVVLTGLQIMREDSNIGPIFYLESYEDRYNNGCVRLISDIASEIVSEFDKNEAGELPFCKEDSVSQIFRSKERVYDGILPKLVNYERNRENLEGKPHRRFLDLAVEYRYKLSECANVTITDKILDNFGGSEEELYEAALRNLHKDGYMVKNLMEMFAARMYGMDEVNVDFREEPDMLVITNMSGLYGASGILCKEYLNKAAEMFGCGIYVLPSSVHEVIAVPDSIVSDISSLGDLVKEVNGTVVNEEEFLSDSVYYYSPETGELKVA